MHTPGEWHADGADVYDEKSDLVATCMPDRRVYEKLERTNERCANARLIAAAPELLEALKAITKAYGLSGDTPSIERAREAIAKAEDK